MYQDPYDFSGMSDEEFLAMEREMAQQAAPAGPPPIAGLTEANAPIPGLSGQEPVAPAAPAYAPSSTEVPYNSLADLSDEEFLALENEMGNGSVIIAGEGTPVTLAQQEWYKARMKDGVDYTGNTQWGGADTPFAQVGDSIPTDPGQYYLTSDGELRQVPGEVKSDEALGFLQGVMKPLNNAAGALEDGLDWMGVPVDEINQWTHDNLGMANGTDDARANQAAFMERQLQNGRRPGKIGQFVGEVAGTAPLALVAPQGFAGAVVTGGLSGAALTDNRDAMGIAGDVLLGGATGGITDRVGRFVTEAPIFDAGLRRLKEAGVRLTPGQMFGMPNVEVAVGRVIPGIDRAMRESADDYGRVVINQAMSPFDDGAFNVARNIAPREGLRAAESRVAREFQRRQQFARDNNVDLRDVPTSDIEEAAEGLSIARASMGRDGRITPAALVNGLNENQADLSSSMLREFASDASRYLPSRVPSGRKDGNFLDSILPPGVSDYIAPVATLMGQGGPVAPGVAATSAVYSRPGQRVVGGALMGDRPWMGGLNDELDLLHSLNRRAAPISGLFGGSFGTSYDNDPEPYTVRYRAP